MCVRGTAERGVRWRDDIGFEMRCDDCAVGNRRHGGGIYWPLTEEFWNPRKGLARCRACWNAREARRKRANYASNAAYRLKVLESMRAYRRSLSKREAAIYREKYEQAAYAAWRYNADPEYRERKRELNRKYRQQRKEQKREAA